jgi:uncharacterized protein YjbJ (UPF0337 family)
MNWDQVEGKWKQMKGAAKKQWGKLTDDDLDYMAGSRDQFVGRLQDTRHWLKKPRTADWRKRRPNDHQDRYHLAARRGV